MRNRCIVECTKGWQKLCGMSIWKNIRSLGETIDVVSQTFEESIVEQNHVHTSLRSVAYDTCAFVGLER